MSLGVAEHDLRTFVAHALVVSLIDSVSLAETLDLSVLARGKCRSSSSRVALARSGFQSIKSFFQVLSDREALDARLADDDLVMSF